MNDVCLLLEGTFPYVAGGVSTWVNDLIRRMHDISFSLVYLGPSYSPARKMHYTLPSNVTDFREYYLFDYSARMSGGGAGLGKAKAFKAMKKFMRDVGKTDVSSFEELLKWAGDKETRLIEFDDIVYSFSSWEMMKELYLEGAKDVSFIDYFWTWRFIYLPLLSVIRIKLPEARVYHSVSTGYAGVLGAMAKIQYKRPFVLTEHGIYTRERKIEIAQSDWIYSDTASDLKVAGDMDFFRDWWASFFSSLSRLAYKYSDEIITLYEGNRLVQIDEGAPPAKTRVIPNGVEAGLYERLRKGRVKDRFIIGFMGRVVPIKDVKTFIKAAKMICVSIKHAEIYIMGPTDEDEDYYKECKALVELEGLAGNVKFTGKVDPMEYYPMIDVLVLTSVSEGQPIVVLEANACGIPVVATDVGSCSELLLGQSPSDKLMGPSGIITPISDPSATAKAVIKLFHDSRMYERMSESGKKRVKAYYQMDSLIARYHRLYYHYMKRIIW